MSPGLWLSLGHGLGAVDPGGMEPRRPNRHAKAETENAVMTPANTTLASRGLVVVASTPMPITGTEWPTKQAT